MSNIFTLKLTPKASRNEVKGWDTDSKGNKFLKCSVTAVPEKGKANKALIILLSKHFKVPKSAIKIVRGDANREKVIEIEGVKTNYKR